MTMTAMKRSERLVKALHNPEVYGHPTTTIDEIQTHTAWVLLTGQDAYKIKKPVDFGFLDFSTLEKRRHWCEEEVRLNRRFAPDLYLGVTEIRGTLTQPHTGDTGPVLEYAVHMRQFPNNQLLSELAEHKQLKASHIDQLSEKIARFHQTTNHAAPDSDYGQSSRIHHWVNENFRDILPVLKTDEEREQLERIRQWTREQWQQLQPHFAHRKQHGCIRECHGDLHLRNVTIIDGEITPFDCIEFNAELRWIDVISEVAFLIMDLEEHGYPHLGHQFLNSYLQLTGDYESLTLLPYYLVYRALVRAKVAILRRKQVSPESQDYVKATTELPTLYAVCAPTYEYSTTRSVHYSWVVRLRKIYSGQGIKPCEGNHPDPVGHRKKKTFWLARERTNEIQREYGTVFRPTDRRDLPTTGRVGRKRD